MFTRSLFCLLSFVFGASLPARAQHADPAAAYPGLPVERPRADPADLYRQLDIRLPDSRRPALLDARGQVWHFQNYPRQGAWQNYPVIVRQAAGSVWFGGRIVGTIPLDAVWNEAYGVRPEQPALGGNGAALLMEAGENSVVDSLYLYNSWDGIRVNKNPKDFAIRNCWIRGARDDAIENDTCRGGLIENCFVEDTFVFLSCRPGKDAGEKEYAGHADEIVTVRNCIVSSKPNPEFRKRNYPLHFIQTPFKWHALSPRLKIENTIFVIPAGGELRRGTPRLIPEGKLAESSNNTLVWLRDEPFTGELPAGFRLVTDAGIFEEAKAAFFKRHPIFREQNAAPTVEVASPRPGEILPAGEDLSAAVVATDPDGLVVEVRFFLDGKPCGARFFFQGIEVKPAGEPFTCEIKDIPGGRHDFHAVAIDDMGRETASEKIAFTVP